MREVEVIQVIRTRLKVAGGGTADDKARVITQYWDMDGNLLCQEDPCAPTAAPVVDIPNPLKSGAPETRPFKVGDRVAVVSGRAVAKLGRLLYRGTGDLWSVVFDDGSPFAAVPESMLRHADLSNLTP